MIDVTWQLALAGLHERLPRAPQAQVGLETQAMKRCGVAVEPFDTDRADDPAPLQHDEERAAGGGA